MLCEYADGFCFPQGSRTVEVNGVTTTGLVGRQPVLRRQVPERRPGLRRPVLPERPPGRTEARTIRRPLEYVGPFQANGQPYPQVQFETDIGGSSFLCNTATGAGCTVPPISASFYPYWSLSGPQGFALGSHQTSCVWNFGSNLPNTIENFGRDAQYGTPT